MNNDTNDPMIPLTMIPWTTTLDMAMLQWNTGTQDKSSCRCGTPSDRCGGDNNGLWDAANEPGDVENLMLEWLIIAYDCLCFIRTGYIYG